MAKSAWEHLRARAKRAGGLSPWQDIVVAVLATIIGYAVLDLKSAKENAVIALVIGLGAAIAWQILRFIWRFVWTVPREIEKERDDALSESPSIIGSADLLIHRLNMDDLAAIDESAYHVNLGIFLRVSVAVTDKPRTVSAFRLELHADGHKYSAEAEREIGHYWHRHERSRHDDRGNPTTESVREDMNNLLALVRTNPIAANTQAEGWLHFELPNVLGGHEPWHNGNIRLYAFDIRNKSYELNTDKVQVKKVDSSEYAELKG